MPDMSTFKMDALFCLFKGEPGTRKSTQALSFPKPQYWFSWDQKMEGIALPMKLWGIDGSQIVYDDYQNWTGAEQKLKKLQVECPYKTIVVDNLGAAGDSINAQTLNVKAGGTRQDGSESGKRIAGIPVNTIEDFNAETSALQSLCKSLKDIGKYHKCNIILIAHVLQTEQKSPSGETHMSRTIVTGAKKMSAKIPGYCHEVYHFNMKGNFTEDKLYTIKTSHSGDDFARTSLPLAKEIEFGDSPLYDKWIVPAISKLNNMKSALPEKY